MKKWFVTAAAVVCFFSLNTVQANDLNVGFVNFKKCVELSKQGKQEKNAFEAMRKQMSETLEKTDKELEEIAKRLDDKDYMDGLSPAAEEELKNKYQAMSQEFSRYQGQFYQLLNKANYEMLQTMHEEVSQAAQKVRELNHLSLILNEESTFAFSPNLDLTQQVIDIMNQRFDAEVEHVANLKQESSNRG